MQPQRLEPVDVVQIDDGVSFGGYQSGITRTVVFGKASARQVEWWNLEKKAQVISEGG